MLDSDPRDHGPPIRNASIVFIVIFALIKDKASVNLAREYSYEYEGVGMTKPPDEGKGQYVFSQPIQNEMTRKVDARRVYKAIGAAWSEVPKGGRGFSGGI